MKYIIKISLLALLFLTACTDKKTQNSSADQLSPTEVEEVKQIETLTDEMEKSTNSIEQKAQELDALLNEIDN